MNQHAATRSAVPEYRLYRERTGESGDFWLHCEDIPERSRLHKWEIAAHRHPALFQIFNVTAGSGEILQEDRFRPFAAPCILFVPPGAVHGFRFARDVDGMVVTALADRLHGLAATDRHVAAFAQTVRILAVSDAARDLAAAESQARIAREIAGRAIGRTIALEAIVALSIVDLVRAWVADGREADATDDRAHTRIDALESLIAAHYRESRPVAFYAARLGLSAAHLNRIARGATGLSVQAMVARRVLEAARRDLLFTPTPVNRIAESLGFGDPAYFNRFFRKQTGMTPGAFRDAERKRLSA